MKHLSTLTKVSLIATILLLSSLTVFVANAQVPPALLDPLLIPKYVNQLTGQPPVYEPTVATDPSTGLLTHYYTVYMSEFYQQILPPGFPKTKVWGYGGMVKDPLTGTSLGYFQNSPGPTFEAVRGIPVQVKW